MSLPITNRSKWGLLKYMCLVLVIRKTTTKTRFSFRSQLCFCNVREHWQCWESHRGSEWYNGWEYYLDCFHGEETTTTRSCHRYELTMDKTWYVSLFLKCPIYYMTKALFVKCYWHSLCWYSYLPSCYNHLPTRNTTIRDWMQTGSVWSWEVSYIVNLKAHL